MVKGPRATLGAGAEPMAFEWVSCGARLGPPVPFLFGWLLQVIPSEGTIDNGKKGGKGKGLVGEEKTALSSELKYGGWTWSSWPT